ncbi:MAG: FkbM family methyltransferase [Methylococcaceae bacterium]
MIADLKRTFHFIHNHPLGSRHQLKACWRWLSWQARSRLSSSPITVPWIKDTCLVLEQGMTGATGNWYCGLHEFYDMALLLHFFGHSSDSDNEWFLDVGANVGTYTVLAGRACGVHCLVAEPVPSTFDQLKRNVFANRIQDRVNLYRVAVGSSPGTLQFTSGLGPMNQVSTENTLDNNGVIEVPVMTLNEITEGKNVSFWKIDVEGFENEVLKGASEALKDNSVQVVLLEADNVAIQSCMLQAGFTLVTYNPWKRILVESETNSGNNNVWVRSILDVTNRIKKSPPITVFGETI